MDPNFEKRFFDEKEEMDKRDVHSEDEEDLDLDMDMDLEEESTVNASLVLEVVDSDAFDDGCPRVLVRDCTPNLSRSSSLRSRISLSPSPNFSVQKSSSDMNLHTSRSVDRELSELKIKMERMHVKTERSLKLALETQKRLDAIITKYNLDNNKNNENNNTFHIILTTLCTLALALGAIGFSLSKARHTLLQRWK